MNKLNKDELFVLSLHLDLPELLSLCESYNRFNEKICKDSIVWGRKLLRDFPLFKLETLPNELKKKSLQEIYTVLYIRKLTGNTKNIGDLYLG